METNLANDVGCKIPLRNKKGEIVDYAICSNCDFEKLNEFKWHVTTYGYVRCQKLLIYMHVYVKKILETLTVPQNYIVDHVSGNKLDNRRSMLNIRTVQQNNRNKRKREGLTSKYIGVYKDKGKFRANVLLDGKTISICTCDTELDAALFRDAYLLQTIDDFENSGFNLNFPDKRNETILLQIPLKKTRSKYRYVNKVSETLYKAIILQGAVKLLDLTFDNEEECAKAVDDFIIAQNLQKPLNFPERYPEYVLVKTEKIDIDENTVRVLVKSKPDIIALIDRKNYDRVKQFSLSCQTYGYVRVQAKTGLIKLHRFIMNETDPKIFIDHRDGNVYNNTEANLRRTNAAGNAQNQKKRKNSPSAYHGVTKHINRKGYISLIVDKKFKYQRSHETEEYAARDRDLKILKNLPGSLYKMNFEWTDEDMIKWHDKLAK